MRGVPSRRRLALPVASTVLVTAAVGVAWLALAPRDRMRWSLRVRAMLERREAPPEEVPQGRRAGSTPLAKELGGDDVMRVLAAPDAGSVYQVSGNGFVGTVGDIHTVEGPFPIEPNVLARLSGALRDPTNYALGRAKGCEPEWHVRVRFAKDADVVDVFLCFHCAQLQIFSAGKSVGGAELDPGKATLLALAREMLPRDAAPSAAK